MKNKIQHFISQSIRIQVIVVQLLSPAQHFATPWTAAYQCYQFGSVTQSCPTLCDPMNLSTPGLPVHHQLLEFIQTHV